jgi:hypothetical protein
VRLRIEIGTGAEEREIGHGLVQIVEPYRALDPKESAITCQAGQERGQAIDAEACRLPLGLISTISP